MNVSNIYLNEAENRALPLMAQGFSSRHIFTQCDVPPSGMGIFTANLRRKTGIADHKDSHQVRDYMERYALTMEKTALTDIQQRVLRYSINEADPAVAHLLSISESEVRRIFHAACEEAAIFALDRTIQIRQARIYLAAFHPIGTPPSPTELKILKLMVDGLSLEGIAETLGERVQYIEYKAREVASRLGFNARGRGVQRQLLRAWFITQENAPKEPPTMSDPAF